MMIVHDADEHAPFAHILVTSEDGSEYIICGYCRHWIGRVVAACDCIASCHWESRNTGLQVPETP